MTTPLWAPWRIDFILGHDRPTSCILCDKAAAPADSWREQLVLCRREHAFVMLNKYPYTNGHLMVVPKLHVASLADLPPEAHGALWELVRDSLEALRGALRPDGLNVGLNFGRVAGAGIADHLHVHLVPRWNGDTNFMPVIADVRVMPEYLEATWERLRSAFEPLGSPER